MTYREALRLALREEMARDERVFLMGEEVGVFEGAYKVTAGLLEEFGEDRVRDTPISEEGFVGAGVGAAMLGERPVVEIMTINFLAGGDGPGDQPRGEDRRDVRRRGALPARDPHAQRRRQPADRPALAVVRRLVRLDARPEGRRARHASRREGAAEGSDPRRRPGAGDREPADLQAERRGAARPRLRRADRARAGRCDPARDVTLVTHSYATVRALHVAERVGFEARHLLPRSWTCARCARSTSRRSPRRCRRRTTRCASRRAGRPTASPPSWPHASSTPASTTSTRRSSASGWPRSRCRTRRSSRLAAMPNEERIAGAVLAALGRPSTS